MSDFVTKSFSLKGNLFSGNQLSFNIINRDMPTNRKSPRLSRLMLSPKQTELMMEEGNYPLTTETLHEDPEREIQVMEED